MEDLAAASVELLDSSVGTVLAPRVSRSGRMDAVLPASHPAPPEVARNPSFVLAGNSHQPVEKPPELLRHPPCRVCNGIATVHSVSPPRIYIETTIPSYLTARRSRDLRIAADQETTEEWWEARRTSYELFVSETVLDEAGSGDAEFAGKRLSALDGLPRLALTAEAAALATRLLTTEIIPAKAAPDALHLAIAAAHAMDFLLTWNCQRPPALPFGQRLRPLAISLHSVANTFTISCSNAASRPSAGRLASSARSFAHLPNSWRLEPCRKIPSSLKSIVIGKRSRVSAISTQ